MKSEDIEKLLGGYATGTLTDRERDALFSAALTDQNLFDALADEEALREMLADPVCRRELLAALSKEKETAWIARALAWFRSPTTLAVAGSVMAALVLTVSLREQRKALAPAPVPATMAQPGIALQDERAPASEARPSGGGGGGNLPAQPKPAPLREAVAKNEAPERQQKRRVAVLDFDAAQAQSKDAGKTASDLLGRKLDESGSYAVIDRKEVDKALTDRNLSNRRLDSASAANLGRSLGADEVIVGRVSQAGPAPSTPVPPPPAEMARKKVAAPAGATMGGFRAAESKAKESAAPMQVTATAINTQASQSAGAASQERVEVTAQAPVLSAAVDKVASSLTKQMEQNTRPRIDGKVSKANGGVLTMRIGAKTGLKTGDRLEVRRKGKRIGEVFLTAIEDATATGTYSGSTPAKAGDSVTNNF